MNAGLHAPAFRFWQEVVDKVLVTVDARTFRYSVVSGLNPNWVCIAAYSKRQRVKEAVVCLRDPFAYRVVRQVAIVAHGDMVVATLLPRIHVTLHNMTVNARLWIVA